MAEVFDVILSSTFSDLEEHRAQVMEACDRLGMTVRAMEHNSADALVVIDKSYEMVDQGQIYLGVISHRYGSIPNDPVRNPDRLSVTELEYRRAKQFNKPILMFVMSDDHPVKRTAVETDPDKIGKLTRLKEEILSPTHPVAVMFDSVADLREKVVDSLAQTKLRIERREKNLGNLHSTTARQIPTPPEPYIAHRYSLLETKGVIGRQAELNLLTGWITGKEPRVRDARILSLVAVGGMGKSALTWKWFNEIAPVERPDLKGRLWWSFYESDAGWETFILRALAYVSGRDEDDLRKNTKPGEREDMLLGILDREPFLLALDGLERLLIAYARMDAAHLHDDEYDQQTANVVAGAIGLPEGAGESYVGQVDLRKCADPRAGAFLRRLASVKASRILITTRLYPAELQAITGYPLPGCFAAFLKGLTDDDAVNLWREFGVTGTREELLKLFASFENYPLLIRALAGEVARYKREPGNFDAWRAANPDFNPYQERLLTGRKSYVLGYALTGLTAAEKRVLETVAAFRMPVDMDTLGALLVKNAKVATNQSSPKPKQTRTPIWKTVVNQLQQLTLQKPFKFNNELELINTLETLETRGLVGWDRSANRYDLHPIVRGVTWSRLGVEDKRGVYTALQGHFEAVPDKYSGDNYINVERFEDLTPAVELYQALIGLVRYEDALIVFRDRLSNATLYRLSASRQRIELLEQLFPDGTDHSPRLSQPAMQAYTLNSLALAYRINGESGRAVPLYRRYISISEENYDKQNASIGLGNLADALRLSGSPRGAEAATRRALVIDREREDRFREAASLVRLGLALAVCGRADEAMLALRRALASLQKQSNRTSEGITQAYRAQAALWRNDLQAASVLADRAWELAHHARYERDFIRAARLQGAAALGLGDYDLSEERLHHALWRARAVSDVENELPALVGLAELARRQGDLDAARELLDDVWEPAARGPYRLWHADAFNELASVERAAGNIQAAIEAATEAYRLAWCDGISADGSACYAYAPGLKVARAHLDALGVQEKDYPVLPPFDESQFEPLPEVEINPEDEYWVDPATVDEI